MGLCQSADEDSHCAALPSGPPTQPSRPPTQHNNNTTQAIDNARKYDNQQSTNINPQLPILKENLNKENGRGLTEEEQRLLEIRNEIAEQERVLDMLNDNVASSLSRISQKVCTISPDISYLLNAKNFQTLFPSLTQDELANLLNIIMLVNAHSYSIYSQSAMSSNMSSNGTVSDKIGEEPDVNPAEESGSSLGSLRSITFHRKPFGFEIAVCDQSTEGPVRLPYVFKVGNEDLRRAGVFAGMQLVSINNHQIPPGMNISTVQTMLSEARMPCSMSFCLPEEYLSPERQTGHRRKPRSLKRKRRIVMCTDCHSYIKKRNGRKAMNDNYYCQGCHDNHVCEYCSFWADEVDTKGGTMFCNECLVVTTPTPAEKFITFSGFPLPFSLRPNDKFAVLHDVDPNDSLGLSSGWMLTTVNDLDVTAKSAYKVISTLASSTFPMTLGFKRPHKSISKMMRVLNGMEMRGDIGGSYGGTQLAKS